MLRRLKCWLGWHTWGEPVDSFTHQTGKGRVHYGVSRQTCSRKGCDGARWRQYWQVAPMYRKSYLGTWIVGTVDVAEG